MFNECEASETRTARLKNQQATLGLEIMLLTWVGQAVK